MQDYLVGHIHDEEFCFDSLYAHVGYSRRHADRCFKELLGKTPREYRRLMKMTSSTQRLIKGEDTILEIALQSGYDSHDGYTKAFFEIFGKLPSQYKKGNCFLPLFIPYPIKGYYSRLYNRGMDTVEKTCLCMITPVRREKRKLIFLRSKKAYDYWSFCEESGCDWEGLFNSLPAKLETAAILTLPPFLMRDGYGAVAAGIEVPLDYEGEIPEGCEVEELPSCEMLFFQSQPFKTQQEFFSLMGEVIKAVEQFDYAAYGCRYADELAPRFNFGGQGGAGAKLAVPVSRIR